MGMLEKDDDAFKQDLCLKFTTKCDDFVLNMRQAFIWVNDSVVYCQKEQFC